MNEMISINNGIAILDQNVSKMIADFERKIKEMKEAEDALKESIIKEMQDKGLLKVETEDITITYIAPTDRETFDSKSFRAEHADLYDKYVRMSLVKESVRIRLK